jgi:excisionase family DNA binding protein
VVKRTCTMATKHKPKNTTAGANGPPVPPGEVMTLAEAAAFLRVPVSSVVELASTGQLPARKIGNDWRILKAAIVDWLRRPQAEQPSKSMLGVIGAFEDDDTLEPMVEEIYRQRKQNSVGG